jgi:hypothetical protein
MPDFTRYRVLQKTIHVGGADETLIQNEVILFDGSTLKRENGSDIKLSSSEALSGAIKVGWIVPESSQKTSFRPKPAGIEVRSAVSTGEKRELVSLNTVQDEERSIGTREEIRSGERRPVREASGDGKVVGRLKTSAKSAPVEVGRNDKRVVSSLDNKSTVEVERVVSKTEFTGDVTKAIAGDDLTELLPEAAKSAPPENATYNETAKTASGSLSVGTGDDGRVVGRAVREEVSAQTPAPPAFDDAFIERLAESVAPKLAEILSRAFAPSPLPPKAVAEVAEKVAAELSSDEPESEASEGDFVWDTSTHWKSRQKLVRTDYWDDAGLLLKIQSLESSRGVLKIVEARLAELS